MFGLPTDALSHVIFSTAIGNSFILSCHSSHQSCSNIVVIIVAVVVFGNYEYSNPRIHVCVSKCATIPCDAFTKNNVIRIHRQMKSKMYSSFWFGLFHFNDLTRISRLVGSERSCPYFYLCMWACGLSKEKSEKCLAAMQKLRSVISCCPSIRCLVCIWRNDYICVSVLRNREGQKDLPRTCVWFVAKMLYIDATFSRNGHKDSGYYGQGRTTYTHTHMSVRIT